MKKLALVMLLLVSGSVRAEDISVTQAEIAPPIVCPAYATTCLELLVSGPTFPVLEVAPGGHVCGPLTVRVNKDGPAALTLSKGVCIPNVKEWDK